MTSTTHLFTRGRVTVALLILGAVFTTFALFGSTGDAYAGAMATVTPTECPRDRCGTPTDPTTTVVPPTCDPFYGRHCGSATVTTTVVPTVTTTATATTCPRDRCTPPTPVTGCNTALDPLCTSPVRDLGQMIFINTSGSDAPTVPLPQRKATGGE